MFEARKKLPVGLLTAIIFWAKRVPPHFFRLVFGNSYVLTKEALAIAQSTLKGESSNPQITNPLALAVGGNIPGEKAK